MLCTFNGKYDVDLIHELSYVADIRTHNSRWPHGDSLLVAGLFFTDYPPSWEKIPPVEDLGLCDPLGEPGWLSW